MEIIDESTIIRIIFFGIVGGYPWLITLNNNNLQEKRCAKIGYLTPKHVQNST